MVKQRKSNVCNKPILYERNIKLSKLVKTPLKVGLRNTEVKNPSLQRVILTSKNEKLLEFSFSDVSMFRIHIINKR